jgi:hypothetical protein
MYDDAAEDRQASEIVCQGHGPCPPAAARCCWCQWDAQNPSPLWPLSCNHASMFSVAPKTATTPIAGLIVM